jgi:phosphomannomutase
LVALHVEGDARVLIRPSGTEPKVKCYFEVVEPSGDRPAAATQLAALEAAMQAAVDGRRGAA